MYTSVHPSLRHSMINANFYDIESLRNIFTLANLRDNEVPSEQVIDIYYLCDDEKTLFSEPGWRQKMIERCYRKNLNYGGSFRLLNLKDIRNAKLLASTFGVSSACWINDPDEPSVYPAEFRIVCDTDEDYDENVYPYLMGYNSYNYDTTMLAHYFQSVWVPAWRGGENPNQPPKPETMFNPDVTASELRDFNNVLFTQKDRMPYCLAAAKNGNTDFQQNGWKIRKNMLMSGRHLDVARLNEKQSKIGLKRLLGMLGYQILESDKLATGMDAIETPDQLYDLIAYNVSDIVNLKNLFYHPLYQAQFELKRGLLQTYPALIYDKKDDAYAEEKSPKTVLGNRLTIDASSAQFATRALCPYGHLKDIETVSFNYPHPEQAKEMGVEPVNVLEEARKFFYRLYPQPKLRARFDEIYDFYKRIEGKNFNDSQNYEFDYPLTEYDEHGEEVLIPERKIHSLADATKAEDGAPYNTCLPYFDRDGKETSCFVLFSTGGVHGAEYNKALYEADMAAWQAEKTDLEEVMRQFGPDREGAVALRKAKTVTMPDGRILDYKKFLKNGRKIADSEYRDIEKAKPRLFKEKTGGYALNPKYAYTSACTANHEDFTSYYPNLLRRMMAFYNVGLGYDRYAEIFQQKQDYGKYMKDKNRPPEERDHYRILREGTKLILNSASGAADATFENNIRMNNQIISMRIIGQLFSWRIGQAQSYAGAYIPSTNTDGLYSVMEESLNNEILERESKDIGVDIEPEPLYLISKDSNNRIEVNTATGEILSASGGTLGCRTGPNPAKSLAHPAIIDWALTEYLIVAAQRYKGLSLDGPFNREIGMNILRSAYEKFDRVNLLKMYQNIIASSPGSISYVYGLPDGKETPDVLPHYNRIFIMRDNTPNCTHLWMAAARVITPAMARKRAAAKERNPAWPDPNAEIVLKQNGEKTDYPNKDVVTRKVTNIDPAWYIFIQNRDLHQLTPEEYGFIVDNLDLEKYLQLLDNAYMKNWRNKLPADDVSDEPDDDA